ncbi:MAG: hypothetical protein ACN4G0_03195 [Polyangiales bacterium]
MGRVFRDAVGSRPPYRETSGYIAVTFYDLERLGDPEAGRLARSVSDWLCKVQEPNGSIANPHVRPGTASSSTRVSCS